jgi:uncharacterized protein YfaS (alpha-2-macroglobulin family)
MRTQNDKQQPFDEAGGAPPMLEEARPAKREMVDRFAGETSAEVASGQKERWFREFRIGEPAKPPVSRKPRDPTVYWNPMLIVSDPGGTARVRFRVPEGPATYRIQADAHDNGRIGSCREKMAVTAEPAPRKKYGPE